MRAGPGLRERKKERTRLLIAETALRLFAERGFEAVTVAQVAAAADVSEGTVFNYFPTKEDLFYSQMQTFEAGLIEAVRACAPGEALVTAFHRVVHEGAERLAAEPVAEVIATAARIVAGSPALQARERQIVADTALVLAALIAEETGAPSGDVEPLVVASALMGAQRALVAHVRSAVLGGRRGPLLAADARAQAERAFERLARGLGDYAIKRR